MLNKDKSTRVGFEPITHGLTELSNHVGNNEIGIKIFLWDQLPMGALFLLGNTTGSISCFFFLPVFKLRIAVFLKCLFLPNHCALLYLLSYPIYEINTTIQQTIGWSRETRAQLKCNCKDHRGQCHRAA